jgi:uncharacterized protein YbjQ (UPF0145 family)
VTAFKGTIAAALAAGLALAPSMAAQQPAQIALIEGDAAGDYRAAGVVMAEVQSASNTLPKQALDEQLRVEARKLGADAVIQVTYQMTVAGSGMTHKASGVAVRYARAAGAVAVLPPAPAAPPAAAVTPAVAPQVAAAVAPPAAPVVVAAPVAAVAAAVAAPVVHAASAAQVELTEGAMPGRRFVRIGPVSVVTHQTSMFPKISPREQAQEALRAEAFKRGADAVIEVKYTMVNSTFSKKGNTASGIAVKFE